MDGRSKEGAGHRAPRIFLVRVGADQTPAGGCFHAPVDASTRAFVYVGIPESKPVIPGFERPYGSRELVQRLARLDARLPDALLPRNMHLDPDFVHGTYGDHGRRAAQLGRLVRGDLLVFYAGLRAAGRGELVYALVGQLKVARHVRADQIRDRTLNAHAQRRAIGADELVVVGTQRGSGRYARCIAVGGFRDGAYRVRRDLLDAWGGLSVRDGFLQRSAVFPEVRDPQGFLAWLAAQHVRLVKRFY